MKRKKEQTYLEIMAQKSMQKKFQEELLSDFEKSLLKPEQLFFIEKSNKSNPMSPISHLFEISYERFQILDEFGKISCVLMGGFPDYKVLAGVYAYPEEFYYSSTVVNGLIQRVTLCGYPYIIVY